MSSFVDKIVKILKEKNYNIAAKDLKMLEGLDKFGTENFLSIPGGFTPQFRRLETGVPM